MSTRCKKILGCLIYIIFGCAHAADEVCLPGVPNVDTEFGRVVQMECSSKQPDSHRGWLELDGRRIVGDEILFVRGRSKDKALWVFSAADLAYPRSKDPTGYGEITCSGGGQGLYLVDLSRKHPKVIQFGVDKACNEFDWASWGTKNAVIALKKDVRFTYDRQTGKMSLPKDIDAIWEGMIIPTPTGKTSRDTPYPNYVKPYVKEIPLPAQAPK